MNSENLQKNFRWITPLSLVLLSGLLACYLTILNGYNGKVEAVEVRFSDTIKRSEFLILYDGLEKRLDRIETKLDRLFEGRRNVGQNRSQVSQVPWHPGEETLGS